MSTSCKQDALLALSPEPELDQTTRMPMGEVVIGSLSALSEKGKPLVSYKAFSQDFAQVEALSTLGVLSKDVGKQISLLFVEGDVNKPIVIGFIHNPLESMLETYDEKVTLQTIPPDATSRDSTLLLDGKNINLEAQDSIKLQCGEASISLNKSGKIVIRGKYILNRASGVNRILGGSVQVN